MPQQNRQLIAYVEFKTVYMSQPNGGYYPVYATINENSDGEPIKEVNVDLICEWRLPDGKVKFMTVDITHQYQFDALVEWLKSSADKLKDEIIKTANELIFPR